LLKQQEGGLLLAARDRSAVGIKTGLQKLCCWIYEEKYITKQSQINFIHAKSSSKLEENNTGLV